jgi:hypothetical protein
MEIISPYQPPAVQQRMPVYEKIVPAPPPAAIAPLPEQPMEVIRPYQPAQQPQPVLINTPAALAPPPSVHTAAYAPVFETIAPTPPPAALPQNPARVPHTETIVPMPPAAAVAPQLLIETFNPVPPRQQPKPIAAIQQPFINAAAPAPAQPHTSAYGSFILSPPTDDNQISGQQAPVPSFSGHSPLNNHILFNNIPSSFAGNSPGFRPSINSRIQQQQQHQQSAPSNNNFFQRLIQSHQNHQPVGHQMHAQAQARPLAATGGYRPPMLF